ncbi:carbohydrate-binding protein [Pseudobacteroides cellulosolvens]|uniref:Carbohydrate binding family 6 n=1 Tax=Pseudobacteroides cellulosolvens ATCC 35603 = DSM 2933 TaxID=398512 RepID=A0A0L6JWJ9_9FIRM|nr:carbohydrate-binding protein [Pseudobacteroides cellulosolvens]KNY30124.1 Carbohydrate binding family 6 [Pseudobacteroides cellulosolvens ATCC 35603 = DSM 2933]
MKFRRIISIVLSIIFLFSLTSFDPSTHFNAKAYADPSQSTDNICVIDYDLFAPEQSYGYYEAPEVWSGHIKEGNGGLSKISSKVGDTACWYYKVPASGYYDISISYPLRDTNAKTAKYTVIKNYEVIDCFYQDQTCLPETLKYYFEKDIVVKIYLTVTSGTEHIADKVEFIRVAEPTSTPTPRPTPSPCAAAIPVYAEAENCIFGGDIIKEDTYLYAGKQGGNILIPNVSFGCGHIPNNIFSAGISLDQNTEPGQIEIRKDSTTGQLLGTLQLINTNERVSCYLEQNTTLTPISGASCNIYLVFKGNCSGRYDWFKLTGSAAEKKKQPDSVQLVPLCDNIDYFRGIDEKVISINGMGGKIGFQLKDMSGNPIPGQTINIERSNYNWDIDAYSITDNSGIAYFNYLPKYINMPVGDVLKVSYYGNNKYKGLYYQINARNYGPGTSTPTPTVVPTPTIEYTPVIIDNSSKEYFEKGEWQEQSGGVNGTYRLSTKIGSTALWRYQIPEDGYYEITALIPEGAQNTLSKYTIFHDGQQVDSFYNINTSGSFCLTKKFGTFMEYKKDSWITVMVKSVSEGTCIADTISVKRLSKQPTPQPTVPSGYSRPTVRDAEYCDISGVVKEKDYITSCDDSDYVIINGVTLSGYAYYDSIDIFSVNASVWGDSGENSLEVRVNSLDGPLLGTFQLKNTGNDPLKFSEQAFRMSSGSSDWVSSNLYVIFKGKGSCNIDWFKFSKSWKADPGSEILDLGPLGKKICGYIKPAFDKTNSELNKGFQVKIADTQQYSYTDSSGYFELPIYNDKPISLIITKDGYLKREINNIENKGITQIGTQEKPLELWPGDVSINGNQDNVVNMKDVVEIAKRFNSTLGDSLYSSNCDFNMDKAINIADIVIMAKYFNRTSNDYFNQ